MTTFSQELRTRRTKKRLSQRQAAKGLGMSYTMLQRYEKGIRLMEMSVVKAVALADFYRWSVKDMLQKLRAEAAQQQERK